MQQMGWHFQVISPAFSIHRGYQSKKSRPAWRERQNRKNMQLVEAFKSEVAAKVGKSRREKAVKGQVASQLKRRSTSQQRARSFGQL